MPKTKILFCILYLARGGTERQLIALINGLCRKRFEPHLCCTKQSVIEPYLRKDADLLFQQINCGKLQIDFKSFRQPQALAQIFKLASYIRVHKIDIVVSYFIDPQILSFLAGQLSLRSPRFVVAFRDLGLLRASHSGLLRFVFRHSNAFVANSLAVKDDYVRNDGLPAEKFTVIGNGLDIDRFTLRQELPKVPKVIGIVANLNRHVKRVDVFVRAIAIVAEKNPEITFEVIGEGGLKADLMTLASEMGLANRIKFSGRSYDISQSLRGIDIGVNTSETEGFANVILEYLAAGIPVVATDSGGNREIIVDSKNGFFFPVNDYEALAARLLMILDDEEMFRRLSCNTVKSVQGHFDMDLMIQRHQEFFTQLMAG